MRGTRAKHLRRVAAAHDGRPDGTRQLYLWLKKVWTRQFPSRAYAALRRIK